MSDPILKLTKLKYNGHCKALFPLITKKATGDCYYGTPALGVSNCTWDICSSTTTFEIPNCKLSKAQFVTKNTNPLNQNVLD